ncbi:DUF1217 domain-containing protein [Jannaschia sp. LMIT008]|uniref:DUF1217 domain-containing protein n=1 Tax=Jannaschia maritima TaxID=3032585 RepID=UPI00281272B4|nr:DUF1217 domain-containing protein [Jannaschia sp. LMIT008]
MFQPVLPQGGIAGWRFLERTLDTQQDAFAKSAVNDRALTYFRENIGEVETAEQLVADRQLREVALAAFGLSDDIDSTFFIQKVLSEGTYDNDALANRLSDRRYFDMARAFGFDEPLFPNTKVPGFADRIEARFREQSFEAAVGQADNSMRLALNAKRELADVVTGEGSENSKWFTIMGTPPLRSVLEGALGLPASFGALDIDRQLEVFKDRAAGAFGIADVSELAEADTLSRVIDLYLVRAGTQSGAGGPTSPALQLLRGF